MNVENCLGLRVHQLRILGSSPCEEFLLHHVPLGCWLPGTLVGLGHAGLFSAALGGPAVDLGPDVEALDDEEEGVADVVGSLRGGILGEGLAEDEVGVVEGECDVHCVHDAHCFSSPPAAQQLIHDEAGPKRSLFNLGQGSLPAIGETHAQNALRHTGRDTDVHPRTEPLAFTPLIERDDEEGLDEGGAGGADDVSVQFLDDKRSEVRVRVGVLVCDGEEGQETEFLDG